jgi:pimeloyl-ACP methyl ester carboxylesterase
MSSAASSAPVPRFGTHGGDIGAYVTNRLGYELPEQVVGIHVTMVAEADLGPGAAPPSDAERVFLTDRVAGQETGGGYSHMQRTRPRTLAYGLTDSPVGLAAWIVDKWREWSDCDGDPERRFTKDQLLTTVTLYWVTGTIGSSFRVYRDWALGMDDRPETWRGRDREQVPAGIEPRPLPAGEQIQVPAAVALFRERWPREWAERVYRDLRRFTEMPRGGHFPALEEPELLADELRSFFRDLR